MYSVTLTNSLFFFVLSITGIVLYAIYRSFTFKYRYWKNLGVPYLEPNWFFGSVKNEILQKETWYAFSNKCYKMFKDNGFGGIFVFRQPALIVCDPELIEKVLMQDFEIFRDRWFVKFDEPLMQSLFLSTGDKWRSLRINLGQWFSSKKVKNMFEQILNCCDNVMADIVCNSVNKRQSIQIEPLAFSFVTEAIASCALGLQFSNDPAQGKRFKEVIDTVIYVTPWKMATFLLKMFNPTIVKCLNLKFIYKEVELYFLQLCKEAIHYRKQMQLERNDLLQLMMKLQEEESNIKRSVDFPVNSGRLNLVKKFTIISSPGNQVFNEHAIASMMLNLFQAGIKPTEVTITFALFETARNPGIQEMLHEEIKLAVTKHNGWTYEAIRDMTYLDQVIQETLRLYSFNSLIVRTVTQPYTIPNTNISLDTGVHVYVPASAIHMDPQYYPSPEVFNPDRFKGNNYKSSSCYMPFGAGPRICVSIRLAVTMMKVYLAILLAKYSVKIDEENMQHPMKLDTNIMFPQVIGGMWLVLEKKIT